MNDLVPDSERTGLIGALPKALRPYASLMRVDRPIGTWLLYWPCAWSVALAGVQGEWALFAWFLLGAFVMRSAGCVYNDIVDRRLDMQVERTRLRPLASGRVSVRDAWLLAIFLSLIGLAVLLQLPRVAQGVALLSIFPVAAYPFMAMVRALASNSRISSSRSNGIDQFLFPGRMFQAATFSSSAIIRRAIAANASLAGPSVAAGGVPASEAARRLAESGSRPRNGTSNLAADASAPPWPKGSLLSPQCGHW